MIVISEPSQITDADIRQLVEQRWTELTRWLYVCR